jgi:hypothetical protein
VPWAGAAEQGRDADEPEEKEESFMRKSSTLGVGTIAAVAAFVAAASIFTGAGLGATSSPTLAVTAPGTGAAGTAIAASSINGAFASSSGAATATGTITFKVFGPQASAPPTCTSGGTTVGTATAAGNGTYHPNAGFTPSQAGNYWWYASYPADANNDAAAGTCGSGMPETVVAKASPTLSVTAPATGKAGSAIAGSSIDGVFGGSSGASSATGTITFTVFGPQASAPSTCTSGGTTVGTATAAGDNTYHPNASFTPSQAGNYWWYASYPSDANNNAATSACGSGMAETVVSAAGSAPAISTKLSADTIAVGGSAYDTASLSGGTSPTGTVTYSVYTDSGCSTVASGLQPNPATVAVGSAGTVPNSAGVTFPTAGTYYWHAGYSGDSNNAAATSACERLVVSNAHQTGGRGGHGGFVCHRVRKHGHHHHRGRVVLVCFRVTPPPFAHHGRGDTHDNGNGGGKHHRGGGGRHHHGGGDN